METVKKSPEDMIQDACNMMARAYSEHVQGIAQEALDGMTSGDIEDTEALHDWLHETCDSDGWVIYTFRAQVVLMVSDNAGSGPEELGTDGFDWSGGIPWSQLAFFALLADITDELSSLCDSAGIDVNDEDTWRAEEAEDEDD